MAENNWKLLKVSKLSSNIKDELWYSQELGQVDIYRNHNKVKTCLGIQDEESADKYFVNFFQNYDKTVKTLSDYLIFSNLKLTKLEKTVLEAIMSYGSYYEESADYDEEKKQYYVDQSCFIGWDIDESEVPGCRGAISSLVRKGILTVFDDSCNGHTIQGYCIHQTPVFKKDGFYHELDIDEDLIKQDKPAKAKTAPKGKHYCKYCGKLADGEDKDLLCEDCRTMFGHAFYSEL